MASRSTLEQCLREGFIDYTAHGDPRYVPRILTNNREKKQKVLQTILAQLYTCDTFFFSVAFITKSGLACIKDALIQNQKACGKILASQYLNFTEPKALADLLQFPQVEVRMLTEERGFHAKGYVFHHAQKVEENYTMVIGSSNLTANALTHNQEWNVFFTSAEDGALIRQAQEEFQALWESAEVVNTAWIEAYEAVYRHNQPTAPAQLIPFHKIQPNRMQQDALKGIQAVREHGENRGLLISATGTGKTYMSAFDVKRVQPKRLLFIVHRDLILKSAMKSYVNIGFSPTQMGFLTGQEKNIDKPYLFATIQTLAKDDILHSFQPDAFDYIVLDEVHHGGARTYQKVLSYFTPKFLLGMTATPERADGFDIYALFHHQIVYEIRLHQALEENMLVPFHYHGITDITVQGKQIDELSDFNQLTADERVRHILHYADLYGSDGERIQGLVFCSRIEEAETLATMFCQYGKPALALSGTSSSAERANAIARLEAEPKDRTDYLTYIFTCDIFNEGVDIPAVNQLILLRPTQSAIVFVQQLGRGLRKYPHKRYVEVLDFIGNYKGNFLLPIALYGDRTYNKEFVRKAMQTNYLPGATSVHFDDIAKEKIYEAINRQGVLAPLRELKEAYTTMQYKLGRTPLMMDFVRVGDKDPWLFVDYRTNPDSSPKYKSFYAFAWYVDHNLPVLSTDQLAVLAMISQELARGKRVEELIVLQYLLTHERMRTAQLVRTIHEQYGYIVDAQTMESVARVLSLQFFTIAAQKSYGNQPLVKYTDHVYEATPYWQHLMQQPDFLTYAQDVIAYGIYRFSQQFAAREDESMPGFIRYERYSRKDVSRILCYDANKEGTLFGYQIIGNTCPIFVTLQKKENIASSTKYEDCFVSPEQFSWLTRSRVTLQSKDVMRICQKDIRKLLFVKKSDAEGKDYYYVGDATVLGSPVETTIANDKGKVLPIVNIQFSLDEPVESAMYDYLNGYNMSV